MLQCTTPDDFVIATGVSHRLEDFVAAAFSHVGLDWHDHVAYDASLKRPNDIPLSAGNPTKANEILGWRAKMPFNEIVARMVRAERDGPAAVS
jgi:GDPmannose 4,6-dehydratase